MRTGKAQVRTVVGPRSVEALVLTIISHFGGEELLVGALLDLIIPRNRAVSYRAVGRIKSGSLLISSEGSALAPPRCCYLLHLVLIWKFKNVRPARFNVEIAG